VISVLAASLVSDQTAGAVVEAGKIWIINIAALLVVDSCTYLSSGS